MLLHLLPLLQETLPPPPAPTDSPDIALGRVIGVVVIALVLIFLLALALKPLVVRKVGHPEEPAPEDLDEPTDDPVQPFDHSAIIPFPASEPRQGAAGAEDPFAQRLQWVTGTGGHRRKLGDRAPAPPPLPPERRTMGPAGRGVVIPFQPAGAVEADPALSPSPDPTEDMPAAQPDAAAEPHWAEAMQAQEPIPEQAAPSALAPEQQEWSELMGEYVNGHRADEGFAALAGESRGEPVRPADSIIGRDVLASLEVQQRNETATSPQPEALDDATLAGITQTVRELLFCANVGELLHGFALYSDPYLFQFMDSTGMDEAEFQRVFGAIPPKSPEEWTRLAGLHDIVRLPDGKIEATATYRDVTGAPANGAERYRFVLSPDRTLWMIDDIRTVERPPA